MPTYDYQCEKCHKSFEVRQKMTEEPLTKCPSCGQETLRRGIGGGNASFQFKGSGFYLTDYCNKNSSSGCGCKDEHTCSP